MLPAAALRLQRVPFFVLAAHCPPYEFFELLAEVPTALVTLLSEEIFPIWMTSNVSVGLPSPSSKMKLQLLLLFVVLVVALILIALSIVSYFTHVMRPSFLMEKADAPLIFTVLDIPPLSESVTFCVSNLCAETAEQITTKRIVTRNFTVP